MAVCLVVLQRRTKHTRVVKHGACLLDTLLLPPLFGCVIKTVQGFESQFSTRAHVCLCTAKGAAARKRTQERLDLEASREAAHRPGEKLEGTMYSTKSWLSELVTNAAYCKSHCPTQPSTTLTVGGPCGDIGNKNWRPDEVKAGEELLLICSLYTDLRCGQTYGRDNYCSLLHMACFAGGDGKDEDSEPGKGGDKRAATVEPGETGKDSMSWPEHLVLKLVSLQWK